MTEPINHDPLVLLARRAAAAGAEVLARREVAEFNLQDKSAAGDWVTDFDRAAEEAIRRVLLTTRPNDELTGEEYPSARPTHPSGYRWSIDPLDGTVNFVRNIAYYCSSVAVRRESDGQWLAGAIHAPALGVEYFAGHGLGAWKLDVKTSKLERLHAAEASDAMVIATGFGYDATRRQFQAEVLKNLMVDYVNVRRIGSAALDLCLVAEGAIEAYAEYGTQEYDWAAGALIAEEAGAKVVRPEQSPGWQYAGHVDPSKLPASDGR
ncbi:inositol monophosphatase family protein [Glutamicibacter sp. PS]|uniref:inositol monophosphatase family protein n=1 Tax=Glutamicibacter sp. PS TaxID=3075634 RepID=UPI00283ADBB4|nr:inositol monophosphatase family protein [Glutamicibacter sp. PS]MDR4533550.1 inositol monophosphatase [Glutamicibacter sp. PS]